MKTTIYAVLISVVMAANVAIASNSDIEVNDDAGKDIQITGSIQLSDDSSELDQQKAAKIDVAAVAKIIHDQLDGKIISIKLKTEDNYLIYKGELINKSGKVIDVIVDAGNGKVLTSGVDQRDEMSSSDLEDDSAHEDGEGEDEDDSAHEAWYEFW